MVTPHFYQEHGEIMISIDNISDQDIEIKQWYIRNKGNNKIVKIVIPLLRESPQPVKILVGLKDNEKLEDFLGELDLNNLELIPMK
jgi:hypothetical protein